MKREDGTRVFGWFDYLGGNQNILAESFAIVVK